MTDHLPSGAVADWSPAITSRTGVFYSLEDTMTDIIANLLGILVCFVFVGLLADSLPSDHT